MSRVLSMLGALIGALFGLALSTGTAVAAAPPSVQMTYTYDGHHHTTPPTYTTTQRGPPSSLALGTTYDAPARPDAITTLATYDYDDIAGLAQDAHSSRVTTRRIGEARPASVVVERSRVAAEGGSRIALNQAAGNAARDAISAAHPGSLIEQTLGTGLGARRLDVLTQTGIGIESKVGRTSLTSVTRSQIAKDSWLMQNNPDITGIQWVFTRSGVTGQIGPTGPLADALSKAGTPWSLAP